MGTNSIIKLPLLRNTSFRQSFTSEVLETHSNRLISPISELPPGSKMPSKTKEKKAASPLPKSELPDDDLDVLLSPEDDPTWIPSKRHLIRNKKISAKNSGKKLSYDEHLSNLPTAPVTPASVSQTTPSSNDKTNPALAQYPLKQSNVNRLASSPPVYQESSVNYEKVRLKERKSKYTVNSYLTLSLDTAEESISFIDPNAANQRTAKKKKQVLKSRSPVPFSDAPTMLGKQKVLTRGMSTESSNSKGRNSSSSSKGDCNYFYKSENLPSTHEQHLIHSPYYRALFGNTAALPNGEIAESNIQPEVKSFRTLSQDSTDSIISKGNLNSPSSSHKHAPRLRTESHDSSTSTSSSSSSSSSSDDEQEYQLKRSHSTGSSHSHSNTQLKRLNSLSNSNNNLRRALYNASVIRSVGNGAEDEEDDAEGSKEEKNELACEVSSEISLPKLTIDADAEDHPSLQNYNEEYPVLRSPKTASQLLLESKGLSPKTSSNDLHSYTASGTSPSSSHKTPLAPNASPSSSHKTPLPAVTPATGKSFPLSLTPPVSATSSSSNPLKTPSSALSNKMSIITNIQQFMMMTPSNQPSSHTKVARSPRFFEVTSATKKRITLVSTPNNNDESVRKVISLNEEGNLLKRSESDEGVTFTAPPASSTFSPFRKELPESFLFSPPNVIPAIAAQTSMITSSIGLASPFMSPSSSFQQLARDNATAERAMAASSQAMRSLKTQDSVDPTSRLITFEPSDLEELTAEDESDAMLMSKSKSRSDDYESHDEQTLEGFIYHVTDLEEHHELINREQLTEDLSKEKSSTIHDVLVRNRSPTFKMPPELEINGPDAMPPLMRQPSFQDTTKFIVDKVKVSRFIFNKIVADAIPKAPIAVQTRVKRWDDPDSDSEEEEDGPKADDVSFMTQLNELVDEYHSQLNLTTSIIQQKQEKKFFLFEHQYYHPLLLHQQSRGGAKNKKELSKKEAKEEKAKQKESLLAFEDVDFLWFHKLIANYLQEENVHYFDILSSLSEGTSNNHDNDDDEENVHEENDDEDSLNHNLHKICQYLISSHFYYHLISLLPNEDQRFSSKIYELIKILYVQIHQNDMKYYESIEGGGGTSELHREKIKLKYLKNLVDRNHLRPTGSVTNTPTAAGGVVSCPSYDSSEGGSVDFKGPYQCQSSDSCDTMMSYTSCEGDLTYREIPLLMLESVYLVCQERYSRCLTSSKQSYEQELDVNFIAQKGFLSISSTVHHYQHPLHHQSNDSSTSFPWANTTTATSSSSVPSSPSSSSLSNHIHASLTTHYSLHSIMQGSKEERQPFRINDSDYYLLELMKYIIKYEYEYMISRLYNGIYDITLVIKNMMIMKYLCLGVMELMKCYGNRLGLTSELVEYPQLLQQLLDVMEALIFFYHTILFELECIENNLITDEEDDDDEDNEDEDDEEGGGGKEIDHYVVILLQKVYILLSSTVNSHLNSNNLFYLVLHFIQNQWKHSNTKPEDADDDSSIERKNYAQEILYIKLFELLLHYLPPERIIFPNVSMYDQISTALPPSTAIPTTQPPSSTKSTTSTTKTTPIITLPSLTMNVYHKLLLFIKQIFYKIILSLDYQHHFKTIQTIFTFFFNQQSLLLYQYCFPIDFSFFLEELKTPTPPAPPPTLNTPPTSVATATTSSTFTFPSTPSMNINGTTTTSTPTTMQRHYQQKLKETKQFNEQNEERLQLLVEKLRVLRSEYWNPMIKNVANQLLDLIFYQMEQLEEANNHDDEDS